MCVVENVRDQKRKAKCAQACVKSDPPPKKKQLKQNTVNIFCDTKTLVEVSNHIRPTSEYSKQLSDMILYKHLDPCLGASFARVANHDAEETNTHAHMLLCFAQAQRALEHDDIPTSNELSRLQEPYINLNIVVFMGEGS